MRIQLKVRENMNIGITIKVLMTLNLSLKNRLTFSFTFTSHLDFFIYLALDLSDLSDFQPTIMRIMPVEHEVIQVIIDKINNTGNDIPKNKTSKPKIRKKIPILPISSLGVVMMRVKGWDGGLILNVLSFLLVVILISL